jgi:cysteinyl-tRNA synthetase
MHTKFLQVDGGKMSKSLGNVYSIDDVEERGFNTRQLRYALIRGHYRTPLNFTWDIMRDVASGLDNLDDLVVRLRRVVAGEGGAADPSAGAETASAARAEFEAGMNDDLNLPRATAPLFSLRAQVLEGEFGSATAGELLEFLARANSVLRVIDMEEQSIDADIEGLIAARTAAKDAKDWGEADRIRDVLLEQGIELQDSPQGVTWRRRS